jgi:hypothetical protein
MVQFQPIDWVAAGFISSKRSLRPWKLIAYIKIPAMNEYLFNLKMNDLEKKVESVASLLNEMKDRLSYENNLWDNPDMIKYWKVSARTLADWRGKGLIGYTQVGGKIWYSVEDREQFLKVNRVSSSVTTG